MMRWMMRWLGRAIVAVAIVFVATYAGDWAIFALRRSPTSKVTVESFQSVPLKGQKTEYDYLGSGDQACSVSLFPQGGMTPCWWLRRHTNQMTNL